MVRTSALLLWVFVVLASSRHVAAAPSAEPRALALGGAYTAVAAGPEALHWNPANLQANRVSFEVSFPLGGAAGVQNSYFSLNRLLLEPERYESGEEFLKDIAGGQLRISGGGAMQAGLSAGGFAFAARPEVLAQAALSEDATRLFTVGIEPGRSYTLTGTGVESAGLIAAGAGFAVRFAPAGLTERYEGAVLAVGANVKHYTGLFLAEAELSGTIDVSEESGYAADLSCDALYTDFDKVYGSGRFDWSNPAGAGYGVDLGVALRPNPKLTFGAAVNNLASHMTWRDLIRAKGTIEGSLVASPGGGPELPEDPGECVTDDESPVATLERRLPMDVRAGLSYRWSPKVLVAADVAKTIAQGSLEHPATLHFGVEVRPFAESAMARRLALRAGLERNGGQNIYSYGVGFGVWKWEFDAAVQVAGSLVPVDATGVAFSAAARLRW